MRELEDLLTEDLPRLNRELAAAGLPRLVVRDLLITE
jgi:hypothetical protein